MSMETSSAAPAVQPAVTETQKIDLKNRGDKPLNYTEGDLRTPNRIQKLIKDGAVALVTRDFLLKCAAEGYKPIQMRQKLPKEAFVQKPPQNISEILVISYSWQAKHHPDPSSFILKRVCAYLRAFPVFRCVFWDFMSIYQRSGEVDERSEDQIDNYRLAISCMDIWYGHNNTTVLRILDVPSDCENPVPYVERGWTTFETYISSLACKGIQFRTLVHNNDDAFWTTAVLNTGDLVQKSDTNPVPLNPPKFDLLIDTKTFTNGADRNMVKKLYKNYYNTQVPGLQYFDFERMVTDQNAQSVVDFLVEAKNDMGDRFRIKRLGIVRSPVGDTGLGVLLRALHDTGLSRDIRILAIADTHAGDLGAHAIVDALTGSITTDTKRSNGNGNVSVKKLDSQSRWPLLRDVLLCNGKIDDGGCARLCAALDALPSVDEVHMEGNKQITLAIADCAEVNALKKHATVTGIPERENPDDPTLPVKEPNTYWIPFTGGGHYIGEKMKDRREPIKHGIGQMWYPDGAKYTGDWQNDRPHGLGRVRFADGMRYAGYWDKEMQTGYGRKTYPDGEVQEGWFVNNERCGVAVVSWPDGTVHLCQWQDDTAQGAGVYCKANGNCFQAVWDKGEVVKYLSDNVDRSEVDSLIETRLRLTPPKEFLSRFRLFTCPLGHGTLVVPPPDRQQAAHIARNSRSSMMVIGSGLTKMLLGMSTMTHERAEDADKHVSWDEQVTPSQSTRNAVSTTPTGMPTQNRVQQLEAALQNEKLQTQKLQQELEAEREKTRQLKAELELTNKKKSAMCVVM